MSKHRHSKRLRFEDESQAATSGQVGPKSKPGGKLRQDEEKAKPSERLRREDEAPVPDEGGAVPGKAPKADKKAVRENKRLEKSKFRLEQTEEKLTAAREKLAAQKPPKKPGPVKLLGRAARFETWAYVHGKIRQVEHENVGIEAAHKTELAGETVVRGTSRFIKHRIRTRPARRVRKLSRREVSARADYAYRKLVQETPELKSNPISRMMQKHRLKRRYAKQAKEAARQGKTAVKATTKVARAAAAFIRRNPKVFVIGAALFMVVLLLQSCVSSMLAIGNGLIGAVGGTSYVATDEAIGVVDVDYTALETALRKNLARIERDYPSYDEYRYSLDEIGHDPFELASYLTAKYNDYTAAGVRAELQALFDKQYTLTITKTVEVRYRTETRTDTWTDSEGNTHSDTYTVEVQYNYYILNVSLRNQSLGAVALASLDPEQTQRYFIYQQTRGNRPYLFEDNIYTQPGGYDDYGIPPEALADPEFAAMITEAEKYLGYPYVWGGSSPSTSFDCSGFVSWVINHSGWDMGRLTAQGLLNKCTPVSATEAKPGDLIFFKGYEQTDVMNSHYHKAGNNVIHNA